MPTDGPPFTAHCPHCHRAVLLIKPAPPRRSTGRTFANERRLHSAVSTATDWLKPKEPEQEPVADRVVTPARVPTVESDVMVPLLRGVVMMTFFFLSSGGLFVWRGVPAPLAWSFCCGAGGFAIGWHGGVSLGKDTLHKVEEWLGVDLDGDGHEGPPPDDWYTVDGEERKKAARTAAEQKHEAFLKFCRICHCRQEAGRGTGQRAMRNISLTPGYAVGDELHKEFVTALVGNGLAERSGNGWKLLVEPDKIAEIIHPRDLKADSPAP